LQKVAGGTVDILVGTHALIQEDVEFRDLGLVVVDEQHRFGVRQRMLLKAKGDRPDTLIMTATPIPRTLSLTLYGDLEVSVIDQLPGGRPGTTTHVISPSERERAYRVMEEEMGKGRQGYVVCPLVDVSESMEVKAAEKEVRELSRVFPRFEVGMIHGQMPRQEREEVMERFRRGEVQLLVSTTVIEVGIDVPNATFILVEDADRFGLSQLHQLRGRVGRGRYPSHCFFLFRGDTEDSVRRRKAIADINDGFRLAEADLEIRGEGSLFGTRQSGFTDLKVARLTRDLLLLERAREDATELVRADPGLEGEENLLLRMEVERRFEDSLEWIFHA
jgi:ATP-dependent DNA helicase RecG